MPLLIAVVAFVGLLAALNLLLTLGVVKRLREHTAMLSNQRSMSASIGVGEAVGEFATSTVDGDPVSRGDLDAGSLVGFFSPTCKPCREKLPKFVEFARTLPGGRDRVLATVIGEADLAAELVSDLSPVARVVVEDSGGPLAEAFKVRAYPTVLMVAPGRDGRAVVKEDRVDLDPVAVAS